MSDTKIHNLETQTPAMRQWTSQKAQVPDAILLFRMGDFYETFYDDARTLAKTLGVTLTSRNKDSENPIPLAGIPYHALDNYLGKLVRAGFKVAISEQLEDPKVAKGVVRRDIVRVLTPGTLTEDNLLEGGKQNFLVALCHDRTRVGAACIELASGDFFTFEVSLGNAVDELVRIHPAELLLSEDADKSLTDCASELHDMTGARIGTRAPHEFDAYHAEKVLCQQFGVSTLEGFGYTQVDVSCRAAGAALAYLLETQKGNVAHILQLRRKSTTDCMHIDAHTWRSLEVEGTLRGNTLEGTLLASVNRTCNPMGTRQLRSNLRFPLLDKEALRERQRAIGCFLDEPEKLKSTRHLLKQISDIERITGRIGVGRCMPRDLVGLGRSLEHLEKLRELLFEINSKLLISLIGSWRNLHELTSYLTSALQADAPLTIREGGIIAAGFNGELDALRNIGHNGQEWLSRYQAQQIRETGISSLKVGFNRVFGYYIEITHSHREAVPTHYVRKQTLKNAERYITDELKQYETEVLTASEKANELEYRLFEEIKQHVATYIPALQTAAASAGTIDMLAGFAALASERGYVCPELSHERELCIVDGKHPVLDQILQQQFVPNDTHINDGQRMLIITGPNMAGKSTYIRQVALLVLLAQSGSYVPARSMRWSLVDRLFARVGASDELSRGQSTFMVEMVEAANILNNATKHSLVILDELGRGTSTYDGLSLAWGICEYMAQKIHCSTLFATHYHELTELSNLLEGVRNFNVAVREWPAQDGRGEKIVFLHKIVEGGTDRSYGVHVARIAGLPERVIQRSYEILNHLESGLSRSSLRETLTGKAPEEVNQLELFAYQDDRLRQALLELDIEHMTPLDAIVALQRLQNDVR